MSSSRGIGPTVVDATGNRGISSFFMGFTCVLVDVSEIADSNTRVFAFLGA